METTFYDDPKYRVIEDFRMLKRPVTLDLDSVKPSKKQKFTTLLTSPDLNMLKLASPELERLIIAQHGLVTTTPTPNQCMYPKNDSNDQEQYARGFADALSQLHQPTATTNGTMYHQQVHNEMNNVSVSNSASCSVLPCPPQSTSAMGNFSYPGHSSVGATATCPPMPPVSSAVSTSGPVTSVMGSCYAPVSNGYYGIPQANINIKEEPQTVPCMGVTPPLSPIDMEDQERIKLERKRLRNRIAASKCRRRKLERIARLEDKVALLKGENTELTKVVTSLREQVCQLKQQVMDHVRCGCEILTSQF